jgi:hypothetical protein
MYDHSDFIMTFALGSTAPRQRVTAAIAQASARTGVAFDYLMNQAQIESGMRPDARARTSSATGLYQFTSQTWLGTLKRHGPAHGLDWAATAISKNASGQFTVSDSAIRSQILDLRTHPETAAVMAAEFASDNESYLQQHLDGNPEAVDLYLAHFLGAKGAGDFIDALRYQPDQAAAPLFPAAAAANRSVFYNANGAARSLREIRDGFSVKLAAGPGGDYRATTAVMAQRSAEAGQRAAPLQLARIEKMPAGLDLDFASKAYQRLSGLSA